MITAKTLNEKQFSEEDGFITGNFPKFNKIEENEENEENDEFKIKNKSTEDQQYEESGRNDSNMNINTQNVLSEDYIDLQFESIAESFMKKYTRYSDRLELNHNKKIEVEETLNNLDIERKVHSVETNGSSKKNKFSLISPFISAKQKSSEELDSKIIDEFKLTFNQQNNLSVNLSTNLTIEKTNDIHLSQMDNEISYNSSSLLKSSKLSDSRFTLPRRKKNKQIFEEFLVIGIESKGLEYINDLDELLLTPKITYNFPNKLGENELKFNIKFLTNFCFNEGVKVVRTEISSNEEYENAVLEKNLFSKPKSYFCLVQQVSPEDIQKYFIFGIKFEDFYVTPLKVKRNTEDGDGKIDKSNYVNVFTYEKTYLFISNEPLCKLFELMIQAILNVKKLNFLHNMSDYTCIFVKYNYNQFLQENSEKEGIQINEILNFYHKKNYPHFEEIIHFKSELNNIFCEYRYPNPFNEGFLAIDWLSRKFLPLIDYSTLYNILLRILLEHSFIFVCDNIQHLTSIVLGISYLISPFKWPFIIIPNLPIDLMNMIESPVPYLIGILGDVKLKNELLKNNSSTHNYDLVYITNEKVELIPLQGTKHVEPFLKNLKGLMKNMMEDIHTTIQEDNGKICERIYKKIFDNLKSELGSKIENIAKIDLFDKESLSMKDEYRETTYINKNNSNNVLENLNIQSMRESELKIYSSRNDSNMNNNYMNNNEMISSLNSLNMNNGINSKIPVLRPSQYNVVRTAFEDSLNEKDKSFGKQFSQTQLFLNYFEDIRLKK